MSKGSMETFPSRSSLPTAVLLMPDTVRTVADIRALPAWPAEQLRLVVERWKPDIDVRIERIR